MRRVALTAAALLAAVICLSPLPAAATPRLLHVQPQDCTDPVPDGVSVKDVTDDGRTVPLDVLVLLSNDDTDGIAALLDDPARRAEGEARLAELSGKVDALIGRARESYEPLGIDLRLTYDVLRDGPGARSQDSAELIALAKRQFLGLVPSGFDAVYVAWEWTKEEAPYGLADCIGGVRYPDTAFATAPYSFTRFPPNTWAKSLAHELGHLLGAHHHYANCVEGIPTDPVGDPTAVCTLMIVDVALGSFNFSTLNGAVVRSYAAFLR